MMRLDFLHLHLHYIYSFSWRFYPKRATYNCYICQRSHASGSTRG